MRRSFKRPGGLSFRLAAISAAVVLASTSVGVGTASASDDATPASEPTAASSASPTDNASTDAKPTKKPTTSEPSSSASVDNGNNDNSSGSQSDDTTKAPATVESSPKAPATSEAPEPKKIEPTESSSPKATTSPKGKETTQAAAPVLLQSASHVDNGDGSYTFTLTRGRGADGKQFTLVVNKQSRPYTVTGLSDSVTVSDAKPGSVIKVLGSDGGQLDKVKVSKSDDGGDDDSDEPSNGGSEEGSNATFTATKSGKCTVDTKVVNNGIPGAFVSRVYNDTRQINEPAHSYGVLATGQAASYTYTVNEVGRYNEVVTFEFQRVGDNIDDSKDILVTIDRSCNDNGGGDNPGATDTDGDGVPDSDDAFPNDPTETKDSDGDGVGDNGDAFPNNPNESSDEDKDGVGDNGDKCAGTASDAEGIDSDGCSYDQRDNDGDGVPNGTDQCADTESGASVPTTGDNAGCSDDQLDNGGGDDGNNPGDGDDNGGGDTPSCVNPEHPEFDPTTGKMTGAKPGTFLTIWIAKMLDKQYLFSETEVGNDCSATGDLPDPTCEPQRDQWDNTTKEQSSDVITDKTGDGVADVDGYKYGTQFTQPGDKSKCDDGTTPPNNPPTTPPGHTTPPTKHHGGHHNNSGHKAGKNVVSNSSSNKITNYSDTGFGPSASVEDPNPYIWVFGSGIAVMVVLGATAIARRRKFSEQS